MPQLSLSFAPLLPWSLWWALAVLCVLMLVPAFATGARGGSLRALVMGLILLLLAGPVLEAEQHEGLAPVAIVVVDKSASQEIAPRPEQTRAAIAALEAELVREGVEMRLIESAAQADETQLFSLVQRERQRLEGERLGAVFLISDGQVHDADDVPNLNVPIHLLQSGLENEQDRGLRLVRAPRFGLLGRQVIAQVLVRSTEDESTIPVRVRVNGKEVGLLQAQVDVPLTIPVTLDRRGRNLVEAEIPALNNEMTEDNNRIGFEINGFRDRLRVLLISGQPHAGQRAWRDLLKSDPAVDLVHFNILRESNDDVRAQVSELSLIAFPVDQLFLDEIQGFDLVIFDRYFLRGHLRESHLAAISRFVVEGGALLTVAGDEFIGSRSIANSVLQESLAALPAGEVYRGAFRAKRTELGKRHPVTEMLPESEERPWGQWYRFARVAPIEGARILLEYEGAALLSLARVGTGRTALLASDQIWLWSRGHDGGGPEAELLRRLVHWLMGEPELEEERLLLTAEKDGALRIERRGLEPFSNDDPPTARLEGRDGTSQEVPLIPHEDDNARASARLEGVEAGFWRAVASRDGDSEVDPEGGGGDTLEDFALVGHNAGRELAEPFSTDNILRPIVEASGGRIMRLEGNPNPRLRRLRVQAESVSRSFSDGGRMAVLDKEASRVVGAFSTPLLPPLLALTIVLCLLLLSWRRESG
ncbi:MAG: hypothetical protein OD811_01885 [Alphaproteobacteria bacterium]